MLFGLVLKRGLKTFPFSDLGLTWKINHFKTLGIHFSFKIGSMFDLNYKTKLKQIDGVLNYWHTRNLSLISNICLLKLFCCHNSFIYFQFGVSKFPNLFWSLIKYFTNLFGMREMIGSKELAFVTIIMVVGSGMIDPYHFS